MLEDATARHRVRPSRAPRTQSSEDQQLQVTALRARPLRGARTVGAARGATTGRRRCARRTDGCGAPPRAWPICWACGPPRATATSARARIGAAAPRRRRNRPSRRSRRLRGGAQRPGAADHPPKPRRPYKAGEPACAQQLQRQRRPDLVKLRRRRRPPWRPRVELARATARPDGATAAPVGALPEAVAPSEAGGALFCNRRR